MLPLPRFADRKLPAEFVVHARHEINAVYTLRDFPVHDDSLEQTRSESNVNNVGEPCRPITRADPRTIGPEEFKARVAADIERWKGVVDKAHIARL